MNAYTCFYESPHGEPIYYHVIAVSASQAVYFFRKFVNKYIGANEWVAPYSVGIRPTRHSHQLGEIYGEYAIYDL